MLVQSVSGVGPKIALALLAVNDPDQLRRALGAGDTATLMRAPGIGKRGAERLVLELKDKVGALPGSAAAPGSAVGLACRGGTSCPTHSSGWASPPNRPTKPPVLLPPTRTILRSPTVMSECCCAGRSLCWGGTDERLRVNHRQSPGRRAGAGRAGMAACERARARPDRRGCRRTDGGGGGLGLEASLRPARWQSSSARSESASNSNWCCRGRNSAEPRRIMCCWPGRRASARRRCR